MCFHRMQIAQSGSQTGLSGRLTKVPLSRTQRRKRRQKEKKMLKRMTGLDLTNRRVTSTVPEPSHESKEDVPTWGQLKRLAREAQQMITSTRKQFMSSGL